MFFSVVGHADTKDPPYFAQISHFIMLPKGLLVPIDVFQALGDESCHGLDTPSKLSLGRRHGTADLYVICLAICFLRLVIR